MVMTQAFHIRRPAAPGQYRLADLFPDLGCCGALRDLFADNGERESVLSETVVYLTQEGHSIFVGNDDGSITIALAHLSELPDDLLYLDIIHELCHVKQHRQGRELYDRSKAYVDRETEIEAYAFTVQEARRIGLSEAAIGDYLHVPWITAEEHQRLCRRLGVALAAPGGQG